MAAEKEQLIAYSGGENLRQLFIRYVTDILGRKMSTALHYLESLKKISAYLVEKNLSQKIYMKSGVLSNWMPLGKSC